MDILCQCTTDVVIYGSLRVYITYSHTYYLPNASARYLGQKHLQTLVLSFHCLQSILPSCPENETLVNWELKVTVGASRVIVAVMPLGVVYTSSEGAPTPACTSMFVM